MRRVLEILTPENVYVEYELAGLGSRFIALIIDYLIQFVLVILVVISLAIGQVNLEVLGENIVSGNSVLIAAGIIIVFLIFFGYFIIFEMIFNGQSPGKKVMKLRVLKNTGEPINVVDSILRNILRVADMLPALYFVGAGFLVFTKNYKRIGDFAANTIVIKIKKDKKLVTVDEIIRRTVTSGEEECVNIYPVNNFEYGIIKEYLRRKDNLGSRKRFFEHHLNNYFMKKFNIEVPVFTNTDEFIMEIIKSNSGI